MARKGERIQLVQGQLAEFSFPWYGEISLSAQGKPVAWDESWPAAAIAVSPELLPALDIELGDSITLGNAEWTVHALIDEMPGVGLNGLQIAPTVLLPASETERSGLVQIGAQVNIRCLVTLPEDADAEAIFKHIQQEWQLPDWSRRQFAGEPGEELRLRTYRDQEEELQEAYSQLDKFLGLLAVFMALLAGIGVAVMTRALVLGQREALGLLPVLGADVKRLVRIFLIQLLAISLLASTVGYALGEFAVHGLLTVAADYVPVTLAWSWSLTRVLLALLIGVGTALIGGSSSLVALVGLKPLAVLRGDAMPSLAGGRQFVVTMAMLAAIWVTCWWQTAHALYSVLLVLALVVIAALIVGIGRFGLLLLGGLWLRYTHAGPWLRANGAVVRIKPPCSSPLACQWFCSPLY